MYIGMLFYKYGMRMLVAGMKKVKGVKKKKI